MALVPRDSLISVAGLISIPVILRLHADGCVTSNCLKRGHNRCRVYFRQNNTYVHIHDQFCEHALWKLVAMVAGCVCLWSSLAWRWCCITARRSSAQGRDCTQALQNTYTDAMQTQDCEEFSHSQCDWSPSLFCLPFVHPARTLPSPTTPLHN